MKVSPFPFEKEKILYPLLVLVIFLTCWEIGSLQYGQFLPSPLAVGQAFSVLSGTTSGYGVGGMVLDAVVSTMKTFAWGLAISVVLGVSLGLVLGYFRTIGSWFIPYITVFYATPRITLIPIIVIWFGIGDLARTIIVFLSAVFPILLNTMYGVRNVDVNFLETAKSFMLSERQVLRKIVLPGTTTFIVSGLRMGVARALIGAITAEFFLIAVGIGGAIKIFSNSLALDKVFVFVIIIAVMGIGLTEIIKAVERHYSKWKVW